jgi:hypothetical protein
MALFESQIFNITVMRVSPKAGYNKVVSFGNHPIKFTLNINQFFYYFNTVMRFFLFNNCLDFLIIYKQIFRVIKFI